MSFTNDHIGFTFDHIPFTNDHIWTTLGPHVMHIRPHMLGDIKIIHVVLDIIVGRGTEVLG